MSSSVPLNTARAVGTSLPARAKPEEAEERRLLVWKGRGLGKKRSQYLVKRATGLVVAPPYVRERQHGHFRALEALKG